MDLRSMSDFPDLPVNQTTEKPGDSYRFCGFANHGNSLAYTSSRSPDPLYDKGLEGGYKVMVKRGVRRVTLFRYLSAKLLYDKDGLHLDEFLVLYDLYYSLLENDDPTFVKKYGNWLEKTIPFYQDVALGQHFPLKLNNESKYWEELLKFLQPIIPSQSAYFGMKGQKIMRQGWKLSLNRYLPPAFIVPKSYIGVGYRDKGSRRDDHDGNPSWQEVSRHFSELERRAEEEPEDWNLDPGPYSPDW